MNVKKTGIVLATAAARLPQGDADGERAAEPRTGAGRLDRPPVLVDDLVADAGIEIEPGGAGGGVVAKGVEGAGRVVNQRPFDSGFFDGLQHGWCSFRSSKGQLRLVATGKCNCRAYPDTHRPNRVLDRASQ